MAQTPRAAMNALSLCHRLSRHAFASSKNTSSRLQSQIESSTLSCRRTPVQRSAYHRASTPRSNYSRPSSSRSRHTPPLSQSRLFSASTSWSHGHLTPPKPGEERHITFIDKDQQSVTLTVADGDNLLDIAQANDLEMEGACGGSCACSTCHIIIESEEYFDKMEEPSDDENDMLDLAFGLTETSRLGCQVVMSKELDGLVVRLPSMTRNLQASDFEEKK